MSPRDGGEGVRITRLPNGLRVATDPMPAVEFWDLTNRQDWELCENAHLGVVSNAWEPGPYSELESQLAAFDRHYLRVMNPEPVAVKARG